MYKTSFRLIATFLLGMSFVFCSKNPVSATDPDNSHTSSDEGQDITVVDGKVKFYISDDSPRVSLGGKARLTKVKVNNKDYTPVKDENGKLTVWVDEAGNGEYNAVWFNTLSKKFYQTPYSNVKLPYSQFITQTLTGLADYPMYAKYTKETGNRLMFREGFAVIDLTLEGPADIVSVNVKSKSGERISGTMSFKPSAASFIADKGLEFAELNCTANGIGKTHIGDGASAHFPVLLCPGKYAEGLSITVTDASHRVMKIDTDKNLTLTANEVYQIKKTFKADKDILYYEGFDTFVWGGDYMAGESAVSFAPTSDKVTAESSADLTGFEDAFASTSYDNPGTGYVQSNNWDDCSSNYTKRKTVATSHRLSAAWVKSRAIGDFINLFRCQERPGYLEVGAASTARGIVRTGRALALKDESLVNAKYEFDICLRHDFDDKIEISVEEGGIITGCRIDGKEIDLTQEEFRAKYNSNASFLYLGQNHLTKPASAAASKKWNHVEITLEGVTSGSAINLTSETSTTGHHGFYVDNICLRRISDIKPGTLRVLSWNIQNGMWSDQANNYDNFVKFVKKYNPDICIWCEAESIYKNGTNQASPSKFLPDGWQAVAARYGHKYVAIGGNRDNYPQVVTSKYPIETLLKITDTDSPGKPVAHGAGLHSVNVGGRKIYVATLHTWPQAYGYGVPVSDREASKAKNEGDYYREFEMRYVVEQTRNNPKFSAHTDWIFAGDFNSRSRVDEWVYNYGLNSTKYLTQNVILDNTDYVDVIAERFKGDFVTSTQGNSRIDYVYMTPSLYGKVKYACTLMDDWLVGEKDGPTGFIHPSDHRPILVDFNF